MNILLVLNLVGKVLVLEGVAMLPSLAVSLVYGGGGAMSLLLGALCAAGVGGGLWLIKPRNMNLRAREGFVTVALCWVLLSLCGALPFVFSGYVPSLIDAFFETVSGFTTTGASILTDIEALPKGLSPIR